MDLEKATQVPTLITQHPLRFQPIKKDRYRIYLPVAVMTQGYLFLPVILLSQIVLPSEHIDYAPCRLALILYYPICPAAITCFKAFT